MTTAAATRKATQRTMQFLAAARLLFIAQGRKTDGYTVEALDTPNAYQLTKSDGAAYNVLLDGDNSLCDCIGFEQRGMNIKGGKGCKHIAALTKLQQLGKL